MNQTLVTFWFMWNKLGLLNWFWQFFCDGFYHSLIRKDSITHIHGPAVYVKGRECFMLYLQKIVWIFTYGISWLYFTQCLSFSSADHLFLCTVFDSNSSNIDEILSIKPSAVAFVFRDLNVHHKNWLTYSGGTNKPGEFHYNF